MAIPVSHEVRDDTDQAKTNAYGTHGHFPKYPPGGLAGLSVGDNVVMFRLSPPLPTGRLWRSRDQTDTGPRTINARANDSIARPGGNCRQAGLFFQGAMMRFPTLAELYAEHQGKVTDKWSLYLAEYDRLFVLFRDQPVRLLEIGVQNGGSLEIWSRFFPLATRLIGCDINTACGQLHYEDPKITVIIGNANRDDTEQALLNLAPDFDIIIDDGSHHSCDIIRSFARYFPHLKDSGLYVVEDIHCSYWKKYTGGLFHPYSAISFFKRLIDVVNCEHWGIEKSPNDILGLFRDKYHTAFNEEVLGHIHSIEFINSICVIRKAPAQANVLGPRVVVGLEQEVHPGLLPRHGGASPRQDQKENKWSNRDMPLEEEGRTPGETHDPGD